MSFSQALSGLNAQQAKLGVTGNNIANSQTVGFKGSNVQFADVYAQQVGLGTRVSATMQNFTQGNIESSGRNLDLAIAGEGFFRFQLPNGDIGYSRNGQLNLTADGRLVNSQGAQIMGFPADDDGNVQGGGDVEPLNVPASDLAANATTNLDVSLNLNAEESGRSGDFVYAPDGRVVIRDATSNELYYIADDPSTHEVSGPVLDAAGNQVTVGNNGDTAADSWLVEYRDGELVAVNEDGEIIAVDGTTGVTAANPAIAPNITIPSNNQAVFVASNGNLFSLDGSGQLFSANGAAVQAVDDNNASSDVFYNESTGEFVDAADNNVTFTQGNFVTTGEGTRLQALAAAPEVTPGNANEYTYSTNATVYDSLGNARNLTLYFTKLEASNEATDWNEWKVDARLSGGPEGAPAFDKTVGTMRFDASGRLVRGTEQSLDFDLGDRFEPLEFGMSFAGSTQFANNSTVNNINQNGYTSGVLVGTTIEEDGTVMMNYSNEESRAAGQIAMVSFRNPEGLNPSGDNLWSATASSGPELVGAPGTGQRGLVQASAIETSNVDLARELVDMIVAQRAYQANSQTISTQDELLQTIINI